MIASASGWGKVGAANPFSLQRAARAVRVGGVIAYPTESVFGLGCDPLNLSALAKLLAIKQRDPEKGLIIIAAGVSQITDFIDFSRHFDEKSVFSSWPGANTWILPAKPDLPYLLTGGNGGIAVRVTAHPLAAALCRLTGALVSTSANLSGQPPLKTVFSVRRRLGRQVDAILNGQVGGLAKPTPIRSALSGTLLRAG